MADDLKTLARNGVLRVAINTDNRALVRVENDVLRGISPALARRLALEIGAKFEPVIYDGAGKVFADAKADLWDVAFLAVDALRAQKISYTTPYISIDATFAVRVPSVFQKAADVDQKGVNVLTSVGSAYDMYLTDHLERATLSRFGTPTESFDAFRSGRADAVAGVRASLETFFASEDGIGILPDAFTSVRQAMVLPGVAHPAIGALDAFVERAVAEGFVAANL